MIIDYTQKKDSLDISYVNNNNQIIVDEIFLKDGYYNYVECDDTDPLMLKNLKSFYGSPIKKVPDKFFKHHNTNEFFSTDLPNNYPNEFEKFALLAQPSMFTCDIEVMPTDEYGYSDSIRVENPITSISITDEKLNTILFIIKNPEQPSFNDLNKAYIRNILDDALQQHSKRFDYGYEIRVFDTEIEMLEVFVECVNKFFHLLMGHNFLQYDWSYIFNRCEKLGVDLKKASPTRRLSKKKLVINKDISFDIKTPTHRIIADQMIAFKESLIYNNLGSYSLNNISSLILGLNKVSYEGNLRTLYRDDYLRFIAYALIDTILVMLIHKQTDLITTDFFQSYFTNVPFSKLSQNSISEAIVYQQLKLDNKFLLTSERTTTEKRKYKGGYVKIPVKKIVLAVIGEDFGALYPNTIIQNGISIDAYIDSINVDDKVNPLTEEDAKKWKYYKEIGYTLLPTGRIYDSTEDYLYVKIEKRLLTQRGVFKGHMNDIYLNIIPKIEEKIKELEAKLLSN